MNKYDVIIIGAGAAGLMCAIEAGKHGRSVLVLDKADKVGKKILISGGGRCNFTNMYTSPDDYLSDNPHFCKSALTRYTPWDFIALLESHHLNWTEKTLGQLFCDQKSTAVVELLITKCESANVNIKLNSNIETISKNNHFLIKTNLGEYQATSLVIATGGPSIPAMGATDFALNIAKQFSIDTIPFSPALVPFTMLQKELDQYFRNLSGISAFVELCTESGKCFKESILFTHRGISGPAALQASSYWSEGEKINVNLFPDEDILSWFQLQQNTHPKAELKTILAYKLPKRLALALCNMLFINKPMQQYNQAELESISFQLHNWSLTPAGTEGMRTAEVSLGGISTNELSSKTFETKKIKGLYFIGESIDVTGHLGGFNFQWAWASGWCAGQYA
ncbi:MAG TPA: NAD(P)/FAD-dependent oxidoreductase [Leucothrix sp.]|nr:NAD(P)/FAD-dependent oxidoreductase [Leucothrix sp.]